LSPLRRVALEETLLRFRSEAVALEHGLSAAEASARAALSDLAERAIAHQRRVLVREAHARGWTRLMVAFDEAFHRTTRGELMDDPALPAGRRARIIESLDQFNQTVGSYGLFLDAMRPLLGEARQVRVLDLASGHGGFPLALARLSRRDHLPLSITASDLRREYLDVGREIARREGLDVTFRVQDALDLRDLSDDPPDLVVCTQAIHHFPAGLVARLFDEAARVAKLGVVLIDGVRNLSFVPFIAGYGYLRARDPGFVHDGVISLRRFFALEELALLARLVPRAGTLETVWAPPSHAVIRYRRPARH
jgi:SAM-dependent methyltransferase